MIYTWNLPELQQQSRQAVVSRFLLSFRFCQETFYSRASRVPASCLDGRRAEPGVAATGPPCQRQRKENGAGPGPAEAVQLPPTIPYSTARNTEPRVRVPKRALNPKIPKIIKCHISYEIVQKFRK